jgi:hypothetical protein
MDEKEDTHRNNPFASMTQPTKEHVVEETPVSQEKPKTEETQSKDEE